MKFYIVDCFAEEKYQGNQLAVFMPDRDLTQAEMQKIAREINFSETSFICSGRQENGGYAVRIFTPDVEVPFAGHPTLGSAYVIWRILERARPDCILLNLKAGQIPVDVCGDRFTMTQNAPEFGETVDPGIVADILCVGKEHIRTDCPIQWVSTGLPSYVIPLTDREALGRCRVDHDRFRRFFEAHDKCNLLVFWAEDPTKLHVRVFMDDTGFLEDPATGSANGVLAGYLLKHDFFQSRTLSYTVSQGAELGRPSALYVAAALENGVYTIRVGGKAYLVAEGNWL